MGKSYEDLEQELARMREEKNKALDLIEEIRKEQRELRPPADFVQLDRATMRAIRELTSKSPTATKILMLMAEKMNKQNAIMITNKAIEGITGASAPTITKSLALLKKENWIKVMKVGTSNAYFVNSAVFWTSKIKNKKFAEFTANIVTSESEQPDNFEKWDDIKLRYMPLVDHKPDQERITLSDEDIPPPDQKDLGIN